MIHTEVLHQVAAFNDYVKERLWLDIDLVECSPQSVVLHCGIDLSVRPDIEIRFDGVFLASLLMTWKTNMSSPVLQVLTGEDAIRVNRLYQVEQGYNLFAFQPEYLTESVRCLIVAQSFSWRPIVED